MGDIGDDTCTHNATVAMLGWVNCKEVIYVPL